MQQLQACRFTPITSKQVNALVINSNPMQLQPGTYTYTRLTPAQAKIIYQAVTAYLADTELSLEWLNEIHPDPAANELYIDAIADAIDCHELRDRITKQFGISERY